MWNRCARREFAPYDAESDPIKRRMLISRSKHIFKYWNSQRMIFSFKSKCTKSFELKMLRNKFSVRCRSFRIRHVFCRRMMQNALSSSSHLKLIFLPGFLISRLLACSLQWMQCQQPAQIRVSMRNRQWIWPENPCVSVFLVHSSISLCILLASM